MTPKTLFLLFPCSLLGFLLSHSLVWCEAESQSETPIFFEARAADASDRAYEPTAVGLIDQAKHSVALSLYLVRESDDARHPVNRLLQDLLEAAQRGVQVELYLNTRFKGGNPEMILGTPALRRLKDRGARVIGLPPNRRLHDKLLIVDERWILEGSSNWSVEALKTNWESNTLMDSPPLAKQKLHRLRQMAAGPNERMPITSESRLLPRTLEIPAAWIVREGPLPRLVSSGNERAFDILLLLLLQSAAQDSPEFFVNLEELGLDAGLPERWDDTTTRRQVIKVLRKLNGILGTQFDVSFTHGKDAWVRFTLPEKPTVKVPVDAIDPASLFRTPAAVTYVRLFELALDQQEGLRIAQLSRRELARRTGLSAKLLRRTLRVREDS